MRSDNTCSARRAAAGGGPSVCDEMLPVAGEGAGTAFVTSAGPAGARTPRPVIAVAPMMDCTDRHARYFLRLISRHALLYTEMVTTGALLRGDPARHLRFHADEHPVALQLGGSEPREMAAGARLGEQWGYDEINMNVGCPSDRVSAGRFGACLMAEPGRVAECVAAMRSAVSVPVSVKCRIGIDGRDSFEDLCRFVESVSAAGCRRFVVHARRAVLGGLSPKHNRNVPPLRYEVVRALKRAWPQLDIWINGGVRSLDEVERHLHHVDGVMIGREAYANPWLLADVDRRFHGRYDRRASRRDVLEAFVAYARDELRQGERLHGMTRHVGGLFQGLPGARQWRRELGGAVRSSGDGAEVLRRAASHVLDRVDPACTARGSGTGMKPGQQGQSEGLETCGAPVAS